jgi:hypothetical protein
MQLVFEYLAGAVVNFINTQTQIICVIVCVLQHPVIGRTSAYGMVDRKKKREKEWEINIIN